MYFILILQGYFSCYLGETQTVLGIAGSGPLGVTREGLRRPGKRRTHSHSFPCCPPSMGHRLVALMVPHAAWMLLQGPLRPRLPSN